MWCYILKQDVNPYDLDLQTVKQFHLLMPASSSCDARTVRESFRKFDVFPQVRSHSVRQTLLTRVLSCERIVTLKSFQRDTILLEGCYQPLQSLFEIGETTLQTTCKALFTNDLRYFSANYIDMWLYVVRNYPWLSDHSSASLKKDRYGEEPVHHTKSNAEILKLASFVASRGFCNSNISNLLRGHHVQIHSEPANTKFSKLTCNRANVPRHNRCSLPRASDFDESWKYLSLQNTFHTRSQPSKRYPHAFAVVRDVVRCFWGSGTPDEIDNPERILHVHQYMEQENDLDGAGDENLDLSFRGVTSIDPDSMQGVSQHPAKEVRPASSVYSRSAWSSSPPTSPQHGPIADSASDVIDFVIDSYQTQEGVSSTVNAAERHKFGSDAHGGGFQENETNEDASIPLSLATRDQFPASTMVEVPSNTTQVVDSELRRERPEVFKDADGVGQTHETLHESQRERNLTNPHRIAKAQHYKKKKKLKQHQRRLTQVLQGHEKASGVTSAQREYINLIDTREGEVREVCDTSSAGEGLVLSNMELAIPQLVHHDQRVDMQSGANQWHANDEDDDVHTATRKAEEQIRGAADAVNEVYDDESAYQIQQTNGNEPGDGIHNSDNIHILATTTSDLFPGGPIEPVPDSSAHRQEPTQSIEAPTVSHGQAETIDGGTSLQDKRKAIYHEAGSVQEVGNSAIPQIQVDASHEAETSTAAVCEQSAVSTGKHESMFPGGVFAPCPVEQVTLGEQSSSEIPKLSKKRNLPAESEDASVHLRAPKTSNRAQKNDWEPFKDTVNAVGRAWGDLDYARIYVTSSVDIAELSAQQHPNQERLWSWIREDQELFDRQMSQLRKKYGFQVICSDAHPQGRRYCTLEHMEYWNVYFGDNEPGYWLAVLTPWRSANPSREKVRRTGDRRNI